MKKEEVKLDIQGTIRRPCDYCGIIQDCLCFSIEGKNKVMCRECSFGLYGHTYPASKKIVNKNYDFCGHCGKLTMKRDPADDRITKDFVFHTYHCENCGDIMKKRIKKWTR